MLTELTPGSRLPQAGLQQSDQAAGRLPARRTGPTGDPAASAATFVYGTVVKTGLRDSRGVTRGMVYATPGEYVVHQWLAGTARSIMDRVGTYSE